jgi:hypothetical protein
MWWSGRFRRRRDERDATAEPTYRPALWAEVALPPPLEAPAWSPADEPVIEAFAPALAGSRSTVRLGFADGTSLELDTASGESDAFRATAMRLLGAAGSSEASA